MPPSTNQPATTTLRRLGRLTARGALRVPEITVYFWVIKALSTAMGESTSDYLVHAMAPQLAVVLGFIGFVIALAIQFSRQRYVAWRAFGEVPQRLFPVPPYSHLQVRHFKFVTYVRDVVSLILC